MALSPGSHLGPYEVLALIGAGGMGEVYRARDPRLGREVAIKVLPHDPVADESRRQRFIQEAKAASALNHPHIVTIHEIESADGIDFLVMEYVRGKSLDALIPRQGMRLNEALRIAIAVADAVAAAHARGIMHRDLKPANVMVGTDGVVKVVDFGLAKLLAGDDDSSPESETHTTLGANVSAPGTIAGTAAYMSPEQALGEKADARSDIFSFGAMLYEMVTGVRAFAGASTPETLNAVIRAQPKPLSTIVSDLPSDLEKLIVRCLRKDPQRRVQHMADIRVALEDVKDESESAVGPVAHTPAGRGRRFLMGSVVTLAIMAGVAAWLISRHTPVARAPERVMPLTTLSGAEVYATFAPDGTQVAFVWNNNHRDDRDLYVTLVGSSALRRLTADSLDKWSPSWSPDGRQIAFLMHQTGGQRPPRIYLISALGGTAVKLSDFPAETRISWSPDSRFVVAGRVATTAGEDSGLYLIPVEGGSPRQLTRARAPAFHRSPTFSPNGHSMAYVSCVGNNMAGCDVYAVDVDATLAVVGSPRRLTRQVVNRIIHVTWTRDSRSLVYDQREGESRYLWRVNAVEGGEPERIEAAGQGAIQPACAVSQDRLAFTRVRTDLDIYSVSAGQAPRPLLTSSYKDFHPQFSPDGQQIAFSSARAAEVPEVWLAASDGTQARQLTHAPGRYQSAPHWSPDGQTIAFQSLGKEGHWHIWTIDAGGGVPRQLTGPKEDQFVPTWSQDGRWVYFTDDDGTGKRAVSRIPALGGQPQRVTESGDVPIGYETADGKSVLYKQSYAPGPLLSVPVTGGPAQVVIRCVLGGRSFVSRKEGVYYLACEPKDEPPIRLFDPSSGRDRVLAIPQDADRGDGDFSVSPDGHTILYTRQMELSADLMLIENFR